MTDGRGFDVQGTIVMALDCIDAMPAGTCRLQEAVAAGLVTS